jgi:hypothetical protein
MLLLGVVAVVVVGILVLATLHPSGFLWIYLILTTSVFGAVDVAGIEVRGAVNVLLYLHLIAIAATFTRICFGRRWQRAHIWASSPFIVLFAWGVFWAVVRSGSTPYDAVVDGKDLLSGGLLLYLGTVSPKGNSIRNMIMAVGLVLALLVVAYRVTGWAMPYYDVVSVGDRAEGFYFFTATYIYLAYVLALGVWYDRRRPPIWCVVLGGPLFLGLVLQGHQSLAVAGTMLTVALPFVGDVKRATFRRLATSACLTVVVIGIGLGYPRSPTMLSNDVRDQLTYREGSLGSRITYNYFRIAAWRTRPLLGFGLLDEQTSLGQRMTSESTSRFTDTVGTVDAGYVDLLVRFGVLGSLAYLIGLARTILIAGREGGSGATRDALVLFLFSMFGVNLVWSALTYSHGLVGVVLGIHLLLIGPLNDRRSSLVEAPETVISFGFR